jgi:hypothetical protein
MDARAEILGQPVYRAWDFLTRKLGPDDMSPQQAAEAKHRAALKAWRAVRDAAEPGAILEAQQAAWEASEEGRVTYRKEATLKRARARVLKREAAAIEQDTTARMQAWEVENPPPARPGADRPRSVPGGRQARGARQGGGHRDLGMGPRRQALVRHGRAALLAGDGRAQPRRHG